jgi:pilus assembly protein CpaB
MKTGRMMVIFAIACGLVAAGTVYIYLGRAMAPKPVSTETVRVVAAKAAISPRTKITQDLVYVREISEEAAHPKAVRDIDTVIGMIAKYEILEGEQIVMDRLYREDERIGLVSSVPGHMRAVTVPVDEVVGVAGFVKPGDKVDIIVTASGVGQTGDVAFTVLEDIEVLAVAQETEDKTQGKAKVSTSVTLAVKPSDAEKLALAEKIGKLRLALRPMFASATKGQGVVSHDLLKQVKGWSPPKTSTDSGETRPSASTVPAATGVTKPRESVAQASDTKAKAPSIVEVIRGSQITYVTLVEVREVSQP